MDRDDDVATTELRGETDRATHEVPPGRMLAADRYRIGDAIGRGGMGVVHAAHDLQIGRDVAIKGLRAETVTDEMLDRFMREIFIQGRLDHPAIVPVHELGIDAEGRPFFVMRKLAGTTLAKILRDPGHHTRQSLLRAFADVCLAVEFAHTRGFVHRDLKPENIVLGDFGDVYILDWGVAKVIGVHEHAIPNDPLEATSTRDGIVVGTPGYMSPEQALGHRDLDTRSDIYTLGCVLFEILAGERLHALGTAGMASAIAGIDGRPSKRAPDRDIPPELDAICMLALATDRERRFPSARQFGEHVQRFLDGDRDLALRRELARNYLAAATKAFASDDTDGRRIAMRLAGRALALDPTSEGAAELVGRLMLEPPRTLPEEVRDAIADDAAHVARRAARTGMWATLGYVAILPFLLQSGFRNPIYPIAMGSLVAVNLALLWHYARSWSPYGAIPIIGAVGLLIAMMARMFSPFLVAPGIAAVSGITLMFGLVPPTTRNACVMIGVLVGVVLLPWIGEETGVLSSTVTVTSTSIIMEAPGLANSSTTSVFLLVGYTVLLVAAAILVATQIRRSESDARKHLHLQAWQLRQLVPAPVPAG